MDNKQLANAYAIAKTLGYEHSVDVFEKTYSQYYSETINELNSKPVESAKASAVQNPFRRSRN